MKSLRLLTVAALALSARPVFSNTIESQKLEIAKLQADLKTATDVATETQAKLDTVTTERDSARTELASAKSTISTLEASVAEQKAIVVERDSTITTLKAEATTVEKKAAQLLAAHGHQPLALGADENIDGAKPKGTLAEQYAAITDFKERTAFFAKHKDKL